MTRVFMTGATGFLGRHVIAALCSLGYDVTVLTRSANRNCRDFRDKVRSIVLPNAKYEDLSILLKKGFDVVYHLAAFIPGNHFDPSFAEACLKNNVMLTLNLLRASAKNGVKRFIYFSAGNTYFQNGLERRAKETDAVYPSKISPFYLGSKMLAEIFVEHYRQKHSLETISLRISSPYGTGMPAKSVVMAFIQKTISGMPIELTCGGKYGTDFVFIGDVVDVAIAAIHSGSPSIYNVGSGVKTSLFDLAHVISDVFERKVPIEVVSEKHQQVEGFCPLDVTKAKSAWGWSPRSLEEGLRTMREEMNQKREQIQV